MCIRDSYKLDRISRSILDFAKMMDFFQKYEVEFVSSTEKFDTSTPMGRAMLNLSLIHICPPVCGALGGYASRQHRLPVLGRRGNREKLPLSLIHI